MTNQICNNCKSDEGTVFKEFDPNKAYSWDELQSMSIICASCGEEVIND